MMMRWIVLVFVPLVALAALPEGVRVIPGAVNGVVVGDGVVVYGDPGETVSGAKQVLFTHSRRDVVWAGGRLLESGAEGIGPEAERTEFEANSFWMVFPVSRFHDYAQKSTKVPARMVRVGRFVKDGDRLELGGVTVSVLGTPGYTPGSVSYVFSVGGKKIACTGDLIYGDGQLLDIYSLQDAIAQTNTRGYHGYAARAGALLASLQKVAAANPDILIPARGPVIENPAQAIQKLTARLTAILESHFQTDALRWYWGYESLRQRAQAAGLAAGPKEVFSMGEEAALPEWVLPIENSRLIVSRSGGAFLLDNGNSRVRGELAKLKAAGKFNKLEGIWVTHYHDDHTDYVAQTAREYDAPVYSIEFIRDILENPARYRMPAQTSTAIPKITSMKEGATMRWREFDLQAFDFPGQTLYHGALRVTAAGGPSLLFVGDSFTASGIDDYCLLNRNFVREGTGYLACLNLIEKLGGQDWLINQHCKPMFRFTKAQIATLRAELRKRAKLLGELTPLPAADFAVDEGWARAYPYAQDAPVGQRVKLELRIMNHQAKAETYQVTWNLPAGARKVGGPDSLAIAAGSEGVLALEVEGMPAGNHVVTASIAFGAWDLRQWAEAMVRVGQ